MARWPTARFSDSSACNQDKSGGDAADDLFDADGSFRLARKATIASAIMWAIGSLVAAYVLYYLYRK
jgi:preprotein translocase subunit SecG